MRHARLITLLITLIQILAHGALASGTPPATPNAMVISAQFNALWLSPDERRMLAGGTDGALWATTDHGEHWQQLDVPGDSRISSFADDGQATVLAVADDYVLRSDDAGQHWLHVELPAGFVVTTVHYHHRTHSWIASAGAGILQSKDQGISWQIVYRTPNQAPLFALTENARGQLIAGGRDGQLLASSDGVNWRVLATHTNAIFARFINLPDRTGTLALWHDGSLTGISADATRTWSGSTGQTAYPFSAVPDARHKQILVGTADGEVLRSRDNGHSWQRSLIAEKAYLTTLLVMQKSGDIFAFGARATVARSSDGGKSWSMLHGNQWASRLNTVVATRDEQFLLTAGSGGLMIKSDDAGQHWQTLRPDLARYVSELSPLSTSGHFMLIGYDGLIASSVTGGDNWQLVNTGMRSPVSLQSMLLDTQTHLLLACGPVGTILRSTDEGQTWSATQPIPNAGEGFLKQLLANKGTLLAIGSPGVIMRSTDHGLSWSPTQANPGERGIAAAVALSPGVFVAARVDGVILRSTDDGQTWSESAPIAKLVTSIHFDEASQRLWAMGPTTFLRSDDLGLNWQSGALPESAHVGYMLRSEGGTLLGFGDRGSIVRSTDQGNTWQQVGYVNSSSLRKPEQDTSTHAIWVPGRDGTLLQSSDDGQHWVQIPTRTRAHLNRVAIDEQTHNMVITGERIVYLPLQ